MYGKLAAYPHMQQHTSLTLIKIPTCPFTYMSCTELYAVCNT